MSDQPFFLTEAQLAALRETKSPGFADLFFPLGSFTIDGKVYPTRPATPQELDTLSLVTRTTPEQAIQKTSGLATLIEIMYRVTHQSALAFVEAQTARVAAVVKSELERIERITKPIDQPDEPHIVQEKP